MAKKGKVHFSNLKPAMKSNHLGMHATPFRLRDHRIYISVRLIANDSTAYLGYWFFFSSRDIQRYYSSLSRDAALATYKETLLHSFEQASSVLQLSITTLRPKHTISSLKMTITHALIKVSSADHRAVVNFYAQVLKPLGSKQLASFPSGMTGFGSKSPEWWIGVGDAKSTVHVAFGAPGKLSSILQSFVRPSIH